MHRGLHFDSKFKPRPSPCRPNRSITEQFCRSENRPFLSFPMPLSVLCDHFSTFGLNGSRLVDGSCRPISALSPSTCRIPNIEIQKIHISVYVQRSALCVREFHKWRIRAKQASPIKMIHCSIISRGRIFTIANVFMFLCIFGWHLPAANSSNSSKSHPWHI